MVSLPRVAGNRPVQIRVSLLVSLEKIDEDLQDHLFPSTAVD